MAYPVAFSHGSSGGGVALPPPSLRGAAEAHQLRSWPELVKAGSAPRPQHLPGGGGAAAASGDVLAGLGAGVLGAAAASAASRLWRSGRGHRSRWQQQRAVAAIDTLGYQRGSQKASPGAKRDQAATTVSRPPSAVVNGAVARAPGPARSGSIAKLIEPEAMVVPTPRELRALFDVLAVDGVSQEPGRAEAVEVAYEKCREITSEYSKTFFLGSQLLGHHEQRAVWAIYNWCRTTDELVDGPAAATTTMSDLDAWADRLDATFASSVAPFAENADWEDLSLADSIQRFSLIKRPFEDMIAGMAMDLTKTRYSTFQELEVYCYRVAGTVGLMTLPVLGFEQRPEQNEEFREATVCAAMSLGMAFQLTNILRDVGEDGRRGRIYVPLEDLQRFNISEEDVLKASHDEGPLYNEDRWRDFMEFQFARCEKYYKEAEAGVMGLSEASRLGVMAALNVYRGILDRVRANSYDNFRQRAFVTLPEKALLVGKSWWRVQELKWWSETCEKEEKRLTSELVDAMQKDGN